MTAAAGRGPLRMGPADNDGRAALRVGLGVGLPVLLLITSGIRS